MRNQASPSASEPSATPDVSRWRRVARAVWEDLGLYVLALASAALLRLASPWPGIWPMAWIALIPVQIALLSRQGFRAFVIAAVFGVAFAYTLVFWLNVLVAFNPFIPIGIVAVGFALGGWVALQAWGWARARTRWGAFAGAIAGAAWWTGIEWFRSLGPYGFPWGQLGLSQQPCLPLLQSASVAGAYGLSFWIVLTNGWIADWIAAMGWARKFAPAASAASSSGPTGPQNQNGIAGIAGAASGSMNMRLQSGEPQPRDNDVETKEFAIASRGFAWGGGPLSIPWSSVRAAVALAGVAVAAAWGAVRVHRVEKTAEELARKQGTVLRVAIIQPNVLQSEKWKSYTETNDEARDKLQSKITAEFLKTLDELALSGEKFDLTVTPESVVTAPYFNRNTPLQREICERARDLGGPIFLGADDLRLFSRDGRPTEDLGEALNPATNQPWRHESFVSSWLIPNDRGFDRSAVYHKLRLVPFGEWLPWFNVIPGFQANVLQISSFTPGEKPVIFPVKIRHGAKEKNDAATKALDAAAQARRILEPPEIRMAGTICFESLFADLHRQNVRLGSDLLVNMTNDAWYGRSSGPAQHFQIAVFRSVENARPMIRCANTGITAILSPAGRIVRQLPFYEKGILKADLPVAHGAAKTIYTRLGDLLAVLALILGAAGALVHRVRR